MTCFIFFFFMITMNINTRSFITSRPRFFDRIEEYKMMMEEVRMNEKERVVDKSFYTINIVGLFLF